MFIKREQLIISRETRGKKNNNECKTEMKVIVTICQKNKQTETNERRSFFFIFSYIYIFLNGYADTRPSIKSDDCIRASESNYNSHPIWKLIFGCLRNVFWRPGILFYFHFFFEVDPNH